MARAKQYADRVNIIKMVKANGKWPFARIVERNGRIIRDHVWVDGRDEHHPEGHVEIARDVFDQSAGQALCTVSATQMVRKEN
jgi:hypothetical protein